MIIGLKLQRLALELDSMALEEVASSGTSKAICSSSETTFSDCPVDFFHSAVRSKTT
jgi:hypothetical protein